MIFSLITNPNDEYYFPYMNANLFLKMASLRFSEVIIGRSWAKQLKPLRIIKVCCATQANLKISQFIQKKFGNFEDDQVFNTLLKYEKYDQQASDSQSRLTRHWEQGKLKGR